MTKTRETRALCGFESTKAGITRHLKTCPGAHDSATGRSKLWQLRVQDAYSTLYWLDVEIKKTATLADLNVFLREVWLECCGHLSAFEIDREHCGGLYGLDAPGGFDLGEKSMNVKAGAVLAADKASTHEYDFGSTTELTLEVTGECEGRIGSAPLRLLARNDSSTWSCCVCGEPATQLHTEEMYEEENLFYCELHRDLHAEEQGDAYAFLPVVNSPCTGVCGYTGPEA